MNRRGFLGAILATCTAPAIVRVSSLMPARGHLMPWREVAFEGFRFHEASGNTLLSADLIARESLRILENTLRLTELTSRDWSAETGTILVRRPQRFVQGLPA